MRDDDVLFVDIEVNEDTVLGTLDWRHFRGK